MVGVICYLLQLYVLVLLVRIVMSWFPLQPGGAGERVYEVLFALTEPVLRPFRGIFGPLRVGGVGLDLSPIAVFVLIMVIQRIICV